MIIRRNKPKPKKIEHNFGGHLPNPPQDCKKKESWFSFKKTTWIDLGVCFSCSELKACPRRKEYLTELKEDRKKEKSYGY